MDEVARQYAVDPLRNVVLEASAGTGKTRVLVERYVNLLRAGVDPDHILAITFTRKAAAEMRERIIERLHDASRLSELDRARWRDLRNRLSEIAISTIDAFCLSLLRECPLEAGVDPGFELADDTDVPRLIDESLDRALRICRVMAKNEEDVALVFAQLGEPRLRNGLTTLLNRRLVAPKVLARYLARGPRDLTAAAACRQAAERLRQAFANVHGGVDAFLADGPVRHPQFSMLASEISRLCADERAASFETHANQAEFRVLIDRVRGYFLTQEGKARERNFSGTGFTAASCHSENAWRRHRQLSAELAPAVAEAIRGFRRDLNVVLSRGVWRIFAVTRREYQRTLDARVLIDFSGVLERAVELLKGLDEFAQSRFRLESRYRHVLVDEFQDTSRAQWELVSQLVRSWGEGFGASDDGLPPSIFIVGDRKQSIYGFRDADVTVLDEAAELVEGLRADGDPRRSISVSFRSAPALLAFINDLFEAIDKAPERADAFRYDETDRFPVSHAPFANGGPGGGVQPAVDESALGLIARDSVGATAATVADEIARLFTDATVRDRLAGCRRAVEPADVAILFRSRDSHREFEKALNRLGVSTYVYKGLGFFEADEIQDAVALLKYLSDPLSDLRAAALLRSRIARLSDTAISRLGPRLANAILSPEPPGEIVRLGGDDRRILTLLREAMPRWLSWVDRMTPAELLRAVLAETASVYDTRGPGRQQVRENLKKLRAMVRRFQNRGYATLRRVASHFDELAVGDESNAVIDARDAVSLMTVHAAKGLEFPIVFIVNVDRGTGGVRAPIRITADAYGEASVSVADYQSEADEDQQARDREETKRLLYVALTRARDRLYLSATVEDATCRMGRGSLGEVLPPTMKALFVDAASKATGAPSVTWEGTSGLHRFVINDGDSAPTPGL